MTISTFQERILSKAYENHAKEKRETPTWRVCIRAPFNQRPVENSEDVELIAGFTKGDWFHFRHISAAVNSVATTKGLLDKYLESHFLKRVDWGQTNTLGPEMFLQVGFVYAMSHQFYVKSEAEALIKEWEAEGLDCFIYSELPEGADLYSYEALERFEKWIQTGHLSFPGDSHRPAGSIESTLRGKRRDSIAKAKDQVNEAFEALQKEGLAIHIKGKRLFWEWDGISLTDAGRKLVEELKEEPLEEMPKPQGQPEIIPPDAKLLRCTNCVGIYYRITEAFDPNVGCTGDMFKLLPEYGPGGSNWDAFTLNDSGESLICPNCEEPYTDPQGFLREGVLIDAQQARAMGWLG